MCLWSYSAAKMWTFIRRFWLLGGWTLCFQPITGRINSHKQSLSFQASHRRLCARNPGISGTNMTGRGWRTSYKASTTHTRPCVVTTTPQTQWFYTMCQFTHYGKFGSFSYTANFTSQNMDIYTYFVVN